MDSFSAVFVELVPSPQFEFIVDGLHFYVHRDVVSNKSKPLDRMMNGGMAEAKSGSAILEDVNKDTFHRFALWLYTGSYKPVQSCQSDDGLSADEIMMSHAQLYVFAEKYDIMALMKTSVSELEAFLGNESNEGMLLLLRYVYANTMDSSTGGPRDVLMEHIAQAMECFMKDDGFRISLVDLMIKDGGPMLKDFMDAINKYNH